MGIDNISETLTKWETIKHHSFNDLADYVRATHDYAQTSAVKAINRYATLRNWLIGCYIVEYEQKGNDRSEYGSHLLDSLEKTVDRKGMNKTLFKNCRNFYNLYPQVEELFGISPTASDFSQVRDNGVSALHKSEIGPIASDEVKATTEPHQFITEPKTLISKLSFSHIVEIMTEKDPLGRFFYETECIKCGWSVKELRRQISTNLYFRSGVSNKPQLLLENTDINSDNMALQIKQPFLLEFLGLRSTDAISENDLENALIDHLQEFLLELGKGFCFEARQKRIIIDDEYYYADLVFYSRTLHCSVIIELKNDEFHHEYLGQLNAYVSYYKENEMHKGDNPPVGILLCTRKGKKMVEYAIAGLDNKLFVSEYLLQLPDKETLQNFLMNELGK